MTRWQRSSLVVLSGFAAEGHDTEHDIGTVSNVVARVRHRSGDRRARRAIALDLGGAAAANRSGAADDFNWPSAVSCGAVAAFAAISAGIVAVPVSCHRRRRWTPPSGHPRCPGQR